MADNWICEVCGREGVPFQAAPACIRGVTCPGPEPDEIITFSMGVYSMKVCFVCREQLSDEELRLRIREKVSHLRRS